MIGFFTSYVVVTIILGFAGLSRGVRQSSPEKNTLCFCRSRLLRLACGTLALLFLWAGVLFVEIYESGSVRVIGISDRLLVWCWYFPLCVGFSFLFLCMTGPRDVCINLDRRICHATYGWACFPRRFDCRLNDTAVVYVKIGAKACYVNLKVQDEPEKKEYIFLLATAGRVSAATSHAQDLASQLGVSFVERIPRGLNRT